MGIELIGGGAVVGVSMLVGGTQGNIPRAFSGKHLEAAVFGGCTK